MVPSILGLFQGIGKDLGCRNISTNISGHLEFSLNQIPLEPLFSVSCYYIILMALLVLCSIAFYLINVLPASLRIRKTSSVVLPELKSIENNSDSIQTNTKSTSFRTDEDNNTESLIKLPALKEKIFLYSLIVIITFLGISKMIII